MSAFAVTFFPDYPAQTKIEESVTLEALAERIRHTSASAKGALPWLKAARFGNLPSPKKSLRWNGNVLRLSGVVADYDGEQISPEEAADTLDKAGVIGLIYTSPSHHMLGHGPRWRVVCPFTREMPADQHYQMVARLNGVFGGILAPESFALSQSYYYGSVNDNPQHRAIVVDGTMTLERCDELDEFAIGKPNGDSKMHASGPPEAPIEDIRAALAVIPNPVPSWGPKANWVEWNNLGMAVWRASGGSDDGFKEFDKWSRKSPKYDGDETEFRWRHYFESPPNDIGFGSLAYWARETQADWQPPSKPSKKQREPLRVIDPITLQDKPVPQRRWLVPGWVPWCRVTGLYGAGGEGKTLLAQMLTTASALGQPWLGLPTARLRALGVFCEDDEDEMHLRQADINKLYDCDFADLENMKWIARLGFDNVLMTFDNGRPRLTDFWHQLLEEAQAFGAQLLIIDTVADTFGGNEIDRGQTRQFGQVALGGLARALDAGVLCCAHPSQRGITTGSGESGSTQWEATFRSRLYLTSPKIDEGEEKDPFARILYRKKANWARRDDEIKLRWNNGVFVTKTKPTGIIASIERRTCERVFLDLLDATTHEDQPISSNSKAGNYAPRLFSKRPNEQRQGFAAADFERAMQSLFAKRPAEIINQTYGRKSDERTRIARPKIAQNTDNSDENVSAAVRGGYQ